MRRIVPAWQLGSLSLGAALLLTAAANAQAVPDGKAGTHDPSQTQRERTPIDFSTIDKPKPEVEIFTGPDLGGTPPTGIVIVPEETAQPPSPPAPPAKQGAPPSPQERR